MNFILSWDDHTLNLGEKTHIIGILNVTPDSFSDGGLYLEPEKAIEQGLKMAREGADIIDVGGESTRPYSKRVTASEEIDRVLPVIEVLHKELTIPISIDTYKSEVARQALNAGASIINDISALRFDPQMGQLAAETGVPIILMHMKGMPEDMQNNPIYDNLIDEILAFLQDAVDRSKAAGIKEDMIIVDPGIGFGKVFDDNLKIIKELTRFNILKKPLVLGTSNKSFIGHILNKEPHERDTGTMATIAAGIINGAHFVRVHNVQKTLDTVKIVDSIKRGSSVYI